MDIDAPKNPTEPVSVPAIPKTRKDLAISLPDVLKESYEWTRSVRSIGKYGERLCDAITQAVAQEKSGHLSCGIKNIKVNSDNSRELKIDVHRVMANALDTNFAAAEAALIALQHVIISSRENGIFKSRALISDADLDENTGPGEHVVKFRISSEVWDMFIPNISSGVVLFNPFLAFKYTPPTYKLYKLLCAQTYYETPISYSVNDLMLLLHDDHKVTNKSKVGKTAPPKRKPKDDLPEIKMRYVDFSRRILEPARKTMKEDPDCNFYFEFYGRASAETKSKNQRGRPKVEIIEFYVHSKKEAPAGKDYACDFNNDKEIELVPERLLEYLEETYELSYEEAKKSHIIGPAYFCMLQHGDNMVEFLLDTDNKNRIVSHSPLPNERKRYLLGMLKKHCKDAYGVDIGTQKEKEVEHSSLDSITKGIKPKRQ